MANASFQCCVNHSQGRFNMMNRKIAVLTLAGVMSAFSLNAFAAGESTSGTPSADGTSQTRDPAPKATNADPDAASLPQGADGNTTDNGPTPSGSKAGGADKAGGGSSSGGSGGS
jgi:hypothetical protein